MKVLPQTLVLPAMTLTERGAAGKLLPACRQHGTRGVLVHGRTLKTKGVIERIVKASGAGLQVRAWQHGGGEPTLADVSLLRSACEEFGAEWAAGVGGGSVLDLTKAAAGLAHSGGDIADFHDGLRDVARPGIPFVAVPTTAGTGSEATTVAVLTNEETGVKKSIRHPSFMARTVILDADLLATCPDDVTAYAGMDAFTQALESYTSRYATSLSDSLALEGLGMISGSLERVHADRTCAESEDLLVGSYLAGLALSVARLGVVHGLAHPLGAYYRLPHGLVCAVCLPHAIELNRDAYGPKYGKMCEAVGGDLLAATSRLLDRFRIPRRTFRGKPVPNKARIVAETLASGSTAANPHPVGEREVVFLLEKLFG